MGDQAITTYDGLVAAITALPPPAPGHIRVFRGQNADFPTMQPTGIRDPASVDFRWPVLALKLAGAIARDTSSTDLDTVLLWVEAIKQHYGPGTSFLDVSHSPEIAVWFALHQMHWEVEHAVYGPPGPYNPATDVIGEHRFARYAPYTDGPAVLFAFDAVAGAGAVGREHGRVFDLALAPDAFSSPRIAAQHACLIYADAESDAGDLRALVVDGTPLRVAWPMEGCAVAHAPTDAIIPPVSADQWYERFVAIPLEPALSRSVEQSLFEHPVPITLYRPDGAGPDGDAAALEELRDRFVVRRPTLVFPGLATDLGDPELAQATPLLLEGPMMTALPTPDRVNPGVLVTDFGDRAPLFDRRSGGQLGTVDLTNVFIEISALDGDSWELAETPEAVDNVRGIWLRRAGATWVMRIATTEGLIGPVEVRYVAEGRRFEMRGTAAEAEWIALSDIHLCERCFVKAMLFVRVLSPVWKVGASAELVTDGDGPGRVSSMIPVEWALGRIVSLRDLGGPIAAYNAIWNWGGDAPFYGGVGWGSPARAGGIRLEGQPYAEVDPAEILTDEVITTLAQRPAPFEVV